MAKALESTSLSFDKAGVLGQLYQSLILYPKGLSQIAKTILSPVTHVRNFVSAGALLQQMVLYLMELQLNKHTKHYKHH